MLVSFLRYTDDELRLMYIQYLTLTERMLRILVPVKFSDLLPTNLREQLVVILLDFPVMKFFPKLHENLRKYCKVQIQISYLFGTDFLLFLLSSHNFAGISSWKTVWRLQYLPGLWTSLQINGGCSKDTEARR